MQAQLANAQYNATNALYNPDSAAAMAALRISNPSLYLQASNMAASADAAAEAAKYARSVNPLNGVNPATLAGMSQSEIAARYGSDVATATSEYFRANPSPQFQSLSSQYAVEHGSIIGSSGRLTPSDQATFQPYNTPATQAMLDQQAAAKPVAAGPSGIISTPIQPPTQTLGTGIFSDVSNFFSSTPGFGFVYGLGASVPKANVQWLSDTLGNTPVLSGVKSGGKVFELQSDYNKYSSMGSTPQVLAAQSSYSNVSRDLSGNFDPTSAVTYGLGKGLQDLGKSYNDLITTPVSKIVGENPIGQFITGLVSVPGGLATTAGEAIPGAETLVFHNLGAFPALAAAGTAIMLRDAYNSATTNPAGFAGQMLGQALVFEGVKAGYEMQPYRVGIERAQIAPSSGQGGAKAGYSSLAITKLSGEDYQIAQINKALIGVGGKTTNPIDAILNSDLLRTTTDARFTTRMNTFSSADEAMTRFTDVAGSGKSQFYHVTPSNDFVEGLITKGSATVGGVNKEGALFFGQPDTILTQYAKSGGVPVALRLTAVPEISQKFLDVVGDVKSGKAAYGTNFAKVSAQLPEGFYPGVRAAAGKAYGGVGLEEEYIVSPNTELYLKSARTVTSPTNQKWLLVDVSLNKPLVPDVKLGAVQTILNAANLKPYLGIPRVPEEYFKFGSPEVTFAPNTPLETSIVKVIAPEEALKYDLGYGVREITSGSKAKLGQATTAIGEVVKARNFPNPNKVTEAILQTEIDYGVKMYGSSIQKGVGVEQGVVTLTRPPNDIDLFIPEIEGKSMGLSFANDVTKAINRAAGKPVVEVDASGTVSLIDKSGKLFDIHNENPTLEELLLQGSNPNKPASPYFGIGMKTEKFLETPEGVGVMTYSEQVGRKLSGTSEFTLEPRTTISKVYEGGPEEFSVTGKIGPRMEGRMKDIPDFYTGEKGNIALMERSVNPVTRVMAGRANTMLEQWLDQWGEPAAKSVRENYEAAVSTQANEYSINMSGIRTAGLPEASLTGSVYSTAGRVPFALSPAGFPGTSPGPRYEPFVNSMSNRSLNLSSQRLTEIELSSGKSSFDRSRFDESLGLSHGREIPSPAASVGLSQNISRGISISPDVSISPGVSSSPGGSPSPEFKTSPSPSLPSLSIFLSGLFSPPSPPYTPSPYTPTSPGNSGGGGGGGGGTSTTIIPSPGTPTETYRKKRKPQSSIIFREILPIITPIEEVGGFKSGKAFYRAIGNQQILEVKPQQRDWLHYVDVDEDVRELQQKEVQGKVSDMAGMNFFRTATKQEKAKTGKPILTYTPTQQEVNMAKMVGFGTNSKPKKGRKNPWF